MTNKKTTLQPLPDINQQRKLVDRLPVLISARIRLNDQQRATLRLHYMSLKRRSLQLLHQNCQVALCLAVVPMTHFRLLSTQ